MTKLPPKAAKRLKKLERECAAAMAAGNGLSARRSEVMQQLGERKGERQRLQRLYDEGKLVTTTREPGGSGSETITTTREPLDDIDAEIAEIERERDSLQEQMRGAMTWPGDPSEIHSFVNIKTREGYTFEDIDVAVPDGDPRELLVAVREECVALRQQIKDARTAPLPLDMAIAKATADIEAKAKSGMPDFANCFRLKTDASGRQLQGGVHWPLQHINGETSQWVDDGTPLICWLLKSLLIERATEYLTAQQRDGALSIEERKRKKEELEAEILNLAYQEEALFEKCVARGYTDVKRRPIDMRALLGVRLVKKK
jgi:hypothetical protein